MGKADDSEYAAPITFKSMNCIHHLSNFLDMVLLQDTVSSEIYASIISPIALEHIFATLKISNKGMIYLYQ